jgi:hypothetical protein
MAFPIKTAMTIKVIFHAVQDTNHLTILYPKAINAISPLLTLPCLQNYFINATNLFMLAQLRFFFQSRHFFGNVINSIL